MEQQILTVGAIKVQGTLAITNSGTSTITGIISNGDTAAILTKAGAGTLTYQEIILTQVQQQLVQVSCYNSCGCFRVEQSGATTVARWCCFKYFRWYHNCS